MNRPQTTENLVSKSKSKSKSKKFWRARNLESKKFLEDVGVAAVGVAAVGVTAVGVAVGVAAEKERKREDS